MVADALKNVVNRLAHMRQYWENASSSYFDPGRFLLALQGCITTSRTVTFILQSNKAHFPDFEDWYAQYQKRWSGDPVMIWARDARNAIEKRGDLETLSQIKCRIVASYLGGPETPWMPQSTFLSPRELLRTIPPNYRSDPQIRDHGTLVIERRWIDRELPNAEVLEALTHVYSEFVDMLADLHKQLGVDLPDLLVDRLPAQMRPLIMDRAIYLSIKDGSETGFRFYQKEHSADVKALRKRYGKDASWEKLSSVASFKELCAVVFSHARAVMMRDSYHHSFAIMVSNLKFRRVVGIDHPTRASRYVLMRELAALAKLVGADSIIVISEAWTANVNDLPPSGYAVDAKNRGEALVMNAADSTGETYAFQAAITRKKKKKHKVKSLGPTDVNEGDFQFILTPFQEAWGCLDPDKLNQALKEVDALESRHYGTKA